MVIGKRERLILSAMTKKGAKSEWSPEDLAKVIYDDRGFPRPPNWRNTVIAGMRILGIKTEFSDQRVVRISGIGRGAEALYKITGPAPKKPKKIRKRRDKHATQVETPVS